MSTPDVYRIKAIATRRRHTQPTKEQKQAFSKYLSLAHLRQEVILTRDECAALATHPYLLATQRAQFAAMTAESN